MSDTGSMGVDVLLVHGAAHESSSWDTLRGELRRHRVTSAVVDLPSSGCRAGLDDDTAVVRSGISVYRPRVVVCHSYGGMPTTAAVDAASGVQLVVYLCAYVPDRGESLVDLADDEAESDDGWVISPDNDWISAADPTTLFYGLVPSDVAAQMVAKLKPQALRAFTTALATEPAWRTTDSVYVVTEHDRAIPPERQRRMAQRTGGVRVLATDHSPFLSTPHATAVLLAELAATL